VTIPAVFAQPQPRRTILQGGAVLCLVVFAFALGRYVWPAPPPTAQAAASAGALDTLAAKVDALEKRASAMTPQVAASPVAPSPDAREAAIQFDDLLAKATESKRLSRTDVAQVKALLRRVPDEERMPRMRHLMVLINSRQITAEAMPLPL
jgi:outer membrane murein-binding lipoprotein Lpp